MLLCFLLDLRNISSSLLHDLKQSLLELANLYALSTVGGDLVSQTEETSALPDRIGLCYIQRNESSSSSSSELKIAYKPGGSFNLRDFHHAVNNLPMNFPTESCGHMPTKNDNQVELSIRKILSDEFLYKWSPDAPTKVIVTTAYVIINSEPLRKILMDAATQLVTLEFVLLAEEVMPQNTCSFIDNLDQLQNCVIHRHISDGWILSGLVRRWLKDTRNTAEALETLLIFKHAIWGSSNQISCKMFASTDMIIDGFTSCQTCRCHGCPISYASNNTKKNVCSVTLFELRESDLIDNAVSIGGRTVLVVPSVESSYKLKRDTGPITLNVIQRTKLASLNEGVIMGTSYIVTPACHKLDAVSNYHDKLEMNAQIFYGLGEYLHCLDQGLVCSSTCNLETMNGGNFMSFYILQPSDNGPMLLRRLAASEEILPTPNHLKLSLVSEEVKNSILASLSKVNLRDYNPLEHERGLHPHLNCLVKDSLHFETLLKTVEVSPKLAETPQKPAAIVISEDDNDGCLKPKQEVNSFSCITDDWEQLLIVDNLNDDLSSGTISAPKTHNLMLSHDKPLDERTYRILERLEAPKSSTSISAKVACRQKKKPSTTSDPTSSQLLRPNFQRLKRKLG